MNGEETPQAPVRLRRKVHPFISVALGVFLVFGTAQLKDWVGRGTEEAQAALKQLEKYKEQSLLGESNALSLKELKEQDVARFKAGLSGLVQSKRTLYEAAVSVQEEKRLLEKQWEIMTTYLVVDEESHRISLMRGDQILKSYPVTDVPPKSFGNDTRLLPAVLRIISKERFAHPERGQSEMVEGKLVYNPPQVGTSQRSNALGEYVMFTHDGLILHGPPQDEKEHEAFPHHCLELSREAARDLYRNSFIGTKILLEVAKSESKTDTKTGTNTGTQTNVSIDLSEAATRIP